MGDFPFKGGSRVKPGMTLSRPGMTLSRPVAPDLGRYAHGPGQSLDRFPVSPSPCAPATVLHPCTSSGVQLLFCDLLIDFYQSFNCMVDFKLLIKLLPALLTHAGQFFTVCRQSF